MELLIAGLVVIVAVACVTWILKAQNEPIKTPESVAPYLPPAAPSPVAQVDTASTGLSVTTGVSKNWATEQDLQWSDQEFEDVVLKAYEGHVFNGFYTKLAGVKHRNEDGTSRTAAVKKCEELDRLDVVWEPENPFDSNAMAVYSEYGQLGFIQSHLAAEQVRDIKRHNVHHVAFFRHPNRHPDTNRIVGAVIYLVAFVGGKGVPTA